MNTITLPASKSDLMNVLLRVVTAPKMPVEVVASAAEMIAKTVRVDNWFLRVAKYTYSDSELIGVLDALEPEEERVVQAWARFEASGRRDADEMMEVLKQLGEAFHTVTKGAV